MPLNKETKPNQTGEYGWLVLYGVSTFVCYLMQNLVYIIFKLIVYK